MTVYVKSSLVVVNLSRLIWGSVLTFLEKFTKIYNRRLQVKYSVWTSTILGSVVFFLYQGSLPSRLCSKFNLRVVSSQF